MEIASEQEELAGKAGRLLKMIAGAEPALVSRADRARRLVIRHLDGQGSLIGERSGSSGGAYLVRDGHGHHVSHDGRFWSCDCPDHAPPGARTCKHILACWAVARAAGEEVPFPVPDECVCCKGKFPPAETIAVEDPGHPAWFEGDLLCIRCAADAAVA